MSNRPDWKKGFHSFPQHQSYHRCPNCGYILESRSDWKERLGKLYKDLECERCDHNFQLERQKKAQLGPLLEP